MGTTARLDRFLLLLVGLLLTAAGVLVLLVGYGIFGTRLRHRAVFANVIGRYVGHHGTWLWPVIAAVVLLLGYLALRWLFAQLTPTAVHDLQLEPAATAGHTERAGAAVTDAVTAEIGGYRGVAGASARFTGDELDPQLVLRVQLDRRADVAGLRDRIETEAVAHVRAALDSPQLPVRLDLVATDKKAVRVS